MSTDRSVTNDLIETLEDGKKGFRTAAEKLAESSDAHPANADLARTFNELSQQREGFAAELKEMAAQYGDDTRDSGSAAGTLHRGWMAVKDMFSGSDPEGVLDVAVKGEAHAATEYEKALSADISEGLRSVVSRHHADIKVAGDRIKALQSARAKS